MAAITTRQTGTTGVDGVTRKNSPLTNTEIDTNFINLNNNKLESSWTGNTSIVTLGTVATGTWNATTISVAKGGTGLTSTPANGALDIGNGSGFTRTTLTGTTNRISVTNGAGSITLSTPQDIATSSNVQFGSLGVGTAASGTAGELRAPLGQITTLIVGTLTFGDSTVQSTAAIAPSAIPTTQVFGASGTFTVPANVTRLRVTVVGGGGGGSAGWQTGTGQCGDPIVYSSGGGGGSGGTAIGVYSVTPGQTYSVTVGSGGTGSNTGNGSAGTASSFGALLSATGGGAGSTFPSGGSGSSGVGSGGNLRNFTGSSFDIPPFVMGSGGATTTAAVQFSVASTTLRPGANGGGEYGSSGNNATGGVGGVVIVEY